MSNQQSLVKAQQRDKLKELVIQQKPGIMQALGKPEITDAFARAALTLINMNEKLWDCQPASFLGALMQSAQLKLDLSLGQAWIIPYYSSKKGITMAQFQIGYQGLIDLFYRHQLASELYAEIVYSKDQFEYSLGTSRAIIHKPAIGERGDMIAVYAIAKLNTGAQNIVVMSVPELHKYKQHYARQDSNGKYGVWDSDFESMAKKTAIKQVLKYMPKAVEIQRAMINDSAVIELPTPKTSLEDANILQISEEPTEYRLPINAESQVIEEIEIKPNDSIVTKANTKQVAKESMDLSSKKIEAIRAIQAAPLSGEEIENLVSLAQNASSQDELDIIIQNMQKQAGIVA